MLKKLKKGFTLAELLIVIAIIAVLTAIAVPLFMGAVNDAKDGRDEANVGAVKTEATIYLLEMVNNDTLWGEGVIGWIVEGKVTADGAVTINVVAPWKETTAPTDQKAKVTENTEKTTDGNPDGFIIKNVWLPRSFVDDKDVKNEVAKS